jgi:uncharacterized membrane protein YvbJ
MERNKSEQERKELNKKLLKSTFSSEIKSKKINVLSLIIDIVCILIGAFFSYLVVEQFSLQSSLIYILINTLFIIFMLFLGSLFKKAIGKRK